MSPTSSHKTVSLDEITVDPQVQRREGIDQRRVTAMAENFNPLALGTVTISQRPSGRLVILDGMHRTAAARQAGHTDFVNAEIICGLTLAQEAELFNRLNATKTPSAITKFLMRVLMGEREATEINAIVEAHGWKVAPGASTDGLLAAVDAVERIYRNGGGSRANGEHGDLLDRTLEIVTAAWEHDRESANGHILIAVAQLLGRYGSSVDTKKLVSEMAGTRPKTFIGKGRVLKDAQGGTVPAALAKILAGMHNKKRRSNLLPEWVWIR